MADLKFIPVPHDHPGFIKRAKLKPLIKPLSAISRLESAGRHTPSLATLKKYAEAVGCDLQVKLVPRGAI
jgi:hypothetical protein